MTVLAQNTLERGGGAAVGAFNGDIAAFRLLHGAVYHNMRNRAGEEDD